MPAHGHGVALAVLVAAGAACYFANMWDDVMVYCRVGQSGRQNKRIDKARLDRGLSKLFHAPFFVFLQPIYRMPPDPDLRVWFAGIR